VTSVPSPRTWDLAQDRADAQAIAPMTAMGQVALAPRGIAADFAPVPGTCQLSLAAEPESARAARLFTTATLLSWGLDGLVQDGMTIASELVTNAIMHGGPAPGGPTGPIWIELTWQRSASRVICTVIDRSTSPPVPASPKLDADTGRGLQIVGLLAAAWGWTLVGTGCKAVWAELSVRSG